MPANRRKSRRSAWRRWCCRWCRGPGAERLLIADMDSTMIRQNAIDELADEAGVGPRVAEITARAMNGELDFEGALQERSGC